jgi:hypothetical protein
VAKKLFAIQKMPVLQAFLEFKAPDNALRECARLTTLNVSVRAWTTLNVKKAARRRSQI